ncbi:alpha/beta fold hydrolase [Microtetraspora glauca]|uniref:Epoxide hydrolase n=1 Tax=Microtetraspora glauca TaxID=1996 RepID=A0ABV3GNK5_MICGL
MAENSEIRPFRVDIPEADLDDLRDRLAWNRYRVARAWAELMRRLGYDRYGTAGNDGGSFVSPEVGRVAPEHVTLAHALADSPAGLLAWNGQLFGEGAVSDDFILTNVMIYWLTGTSASAARFYYEDDKADHPQEPTTVPTGLANFKDDFQSIRRFAERDHKNIVSWNTYDSGGHYAAHQVPGLLVEDIRGFFRELS